MPMMGGGVPMMGAPQMYGITPPEQMSPPRQMLQSFDGLGTQGDRLQAAINGLNYAHDHGQIRGQKQVSAC